MNACVGRPLSAEPSECGAEARSPSFAEGKRRVRGTSIRALAESALGFSLVEVLVALVVVGVGALAIGLLFPRATRDIGTSERTTRAAEYLQEGVERLTSLQYNDPLLTAGAVHEDSANPLAGGYERSWTVTEDQPIPGCKTLVIEIAWQEGSTERSVRGATAVASVGR
jgi:prepilin-type N-terminal cleavage/methylation domain-containing protein